MPKKEKEPEEDKEKSSEKGSEKESEEKGSAVTKEKVCTMEIKPGDYASWGLGRGVDITKQKPWVEKSSFHVREVDVTSDDIIIETKEGGLLKAYSEEIRSRTTVNSEVQAGVKPANTPLSVRMDVEYTRSALSAKYVSGKKIKTRTISFGVNFADVPASLAKTVAEAKRDAVDQKRPSLRDNGRSKAFGSVENVYEIKSLGVRSAKSEEWPPQQRDSIDHGSEASKPRFRLSESAAPPEPDHKSAAGSIMLRSLPSSPPVFDAEEVKQKIHPVTMHFGATFEERLCSWLLHCLQRLSYHHHNVESLQELIHIHALDGEPPEGDKLFEEIQKYLDHFVQEFKITHYVSAIELGALEYRELTWKEFVHQAKVSSKASVTAATYGGAEASATQKIARAERSKNYEMKKIGVMRDDKVMQEAVIGCSLYPISGLLKMAYLQHALRQSIDKYVMEASTGT